MHTNDPVPRQAPNTSGRRHRRRSPLRACRPVGTVIRAVTRFFVAVGVDRGATGRTDLRVVRSVADVDDGSDAATTATPAGGDDGRSYTVVGVSEFDGGPFIVAAVLSGEVPVVDNNFGSGRFQRHSIFVMATDPDEAEEFAAGELAEVHPAA